MASRARKPPQVTTSEVEFHKGEILLMVSDTYPSLPLTAAECWQNAIDGGATTICVVFDLQGRSVYIADNGNGVSEEKFEQALLSVGRSRKDMTSLGRFGRGLISPLSKGRSYDFISQFGDGPAIKWTFEQAKIKKMEKQIHIPKTNLATLPSFPATFKAAAEGLQTRWRTMVIMHDLIKDRAITSVDMDDFEELIRTKFGSTMYKQNISGRVVIRDLDGKIHTKDIKPETYTGEPLAIFTLEGRNAGKVTFELFRALKRKGVRKGVVTVCEMDNPSGVRWSDFMKQARMSGWADGSEGFAALGSGFFEGVIKVEHIHLAAERTKFTFNDAVQDLYTVISEWFEEVGRDLYDEDKRRSTEERLEELTRRTMDRVKEMLADTKYSKLRELLDRVKVTTNPFPNDPDPHAGADGDAEGEPEEDIPPTDPGEGGGGSGGGGGGGRLRGPRNRGGRSSGPRPAPVGDESVGLWIVHAPFEYSSRLWNFDPDRGILGINVVNPVWVALDDTENPKRGAKNDRAVEKLQLWLVISVLSLLNTPPEMRDEAIAMIDLQVKPLVELFFATS